MFTDSMDSDVVILAKYLKFYTSLDQLVGDIPTGKKLHSGGVIYRSNEKKLEVPLDVMSTAVYLELDDVYDFNIGKICISIHQFAENMLNQMKKNMLETLTQVTDFTGNVVDGKGKSLDEVYLEAIEITYMDFDDDGNPQLPNMIGFDVEAFIRKVNAEEGLKFRYDEIIRKKRDTYYAEKGCRRLSRLN